MYGIIGVVIILTEKTHVQLFVIFTLVVSQYDLKFGVFAESDEAFLYKTLYAQKGSYVKIPKCSPIRGFVFSFLFENPKPLD